MVVDVMQDTMYLDNLDEYVNDEGKIVTYKWLSYTLNVHTNVAKQMLYHFVTSQHDSNKGDDLSVTYMVSGVTAGEGDHPDVHQMMLVREENLAVVKSRMKDVISVHIYSVQKKKLQDMSTLYSANYDIVKENIMNINRYSGIECAEAKVRSSADLAKIQQQNAYQAPPEPAKIESKYKPSQIKTAQKESGTENDGKHSKNSSGLGKQNNQIASMFARQVKKSEEMKDEGIKLGKDAKKTPPSAGTKTKPNISSYFNKGSPPIKSETPESTKSSLLTGESDVSSPITTTESSQSSPTKSDPTLSSPLKTASTTSSKSKSQVLVKEMKVDSMDFDSLTKENIQPSKNNSQGKDCHVQSKIKVNKAPQRKGKTKRTEDGRDMPKTKRKRIMHLSDSESSSEEEDHCEEEVVLVPSPPPPEPLRIESDSDEDIPATPQPESVDLLDKEARKRKRKLVEKTFLCGEFLMTNKEYEYVDDSGEEESVSPKKEAFPGNKMEISPTKTDSASQTKTQNSPQSRTKDSPKKKSTVLKKHKALDSKKKQLKILSFFTKK